MHAIGKENIRQILVGNLHNANLPINLSAKESDWEGFVKRPETLHIRGVKTTFNNPISTNNCRIKFLCQTDTRYCVTCVTSIAVDMS